MSNKVDEIREQMGKLHKKYNPFTDFNFENDLSIEEYVYHLGDWFKGLLNQFKSLEDTANEVNEQAAEYAESAETALEEIQNIVENFEISIDDDLSLSSTDPVQNKVITAALNNKQDILTAGTGISIVNNTISVSYQNAEGVYY